MSDQSADLLLREVLDRRSKEARTGWKVALNVPSMQRRLGLTRAVAAPIYTLDIAENGARLVVPAEARLHVEAELAVRLKADLLAPKTAEELRAWVACYAPALELVDYQKSRDGLSAMFGHSFFHAGVVLGDWQSADAFEALSPDLPTAVDADGRRYPRLADTVPLDVLEALAGLLQRVLAAGATLRAGEIVICGSYIEPVPLLPGKVVSVSYGLAHAQLSIGRA